MMRLLQATVWLVLTQAAHAQEQLPVITLDPAEEPAQVTAPGEAPAAWFYENYRFAERPPSVADQAALQQLHRGMDSGYQPYVFCCGAVGDHEELVSWEHRVPITAEVLNEYRLMPGQIIDAYTYQRIASALTKSRNEEAIRGGGDFLDRLQN
jgi:hypothetical protein